MALKSDTIAAAVITKFGGINATARALSADGKPFPVTTVQGWGERGQIPQDHWPALMAAAERNSIALSVADLLPPSLAAKVVAA